MRRELFTDPLLLMERLGQWATDRRRLRRLRGTPAAGLGKGHIDLLELLDLVRVRCGAPRVIFDIGANVGTWTLLAKALFPMAEVHAFEPLEAHAQRFLAATRGFGDVHLHTVALGDHCHGLKLHVTDFSDASSLLPLTGAGERQWQIRQTGSVAVDVVALDEWIAGRGLPWPDLVKLDIQGYELAALKGASAALAHATAVLVEVSFDTFYAGQCLAHDVSALLASSGFKFASLAATTPVGTILPQADALYVKACA